MMFGGFTDSAQKALRLAQEYAQEQGFNYVGTEHILMGLSQSDGVAGQVLRDHGLTVQEIIQCAEQAVGKGDYNINESFDFTPRSKRILEMSMQQAREMGQNYVGTEHILLALLREREGVAAHIVAQLAKPEEIVQGLREKLAQGGEAAQSAGAKGGKKNSSTPTLDQYGRDLTQTAARP